MKTLKEYKELFNKLYEEKEEQILISMDVRAPETSKEIIIPINKHIAITRVILNHAMPYDTQGQIISSAISEARIFTNNSSEFPDNGYNISKEHIAYSMVAANNASNLVINFETPLLVKSGSAIVAVAGCDVNNIVIHFRAIVYFKTIYE